MSVWDYISAPIDKIVDSIGKAIDENVTSDEERLKLRNELMTALNDAEFKANKLELQYQQELTKRQGLDMKSDSWLSKNVRPLTLIFLLSTTTALAITDGNFNFDYSTMEAGKEVIKTFAFSVKQPWVDLYTTMAVTAVAFYFGGRSWEKSTKIKHGE